MNAIVEAGQNQTEKMDLNGGRDKPERERSWAVQ
jgi:hypothetical protein